MSSQSERSEEIVVPSVSQLRSFSSVVLRGRGVRSTSRLVPLLPLNTKTTVLTLVTVSVFSSGMPSQELSYTKESLSKVVVSLKDL